MCIVLRENEGLGHFCAAGKDFGEQFVLEGSGDSANLVRRDYVAVELIGIIFEIVAELFPSRSAGLAVALLHIETSVYLGAGLRDCGADAIHIVVDVDAVGHGLLVRVFHHQVLTKEPEGLLVRRGRQADEVGIEIFEHLRPQIVDGPVTFIGDDDVEGLDGDGRIVVDGLGLFEESFKPDYGGFLVLFCEFSSLEHGVQALNGADADAGGHVELIAGKPLNDEFFRELKVVIERDVLLEFFERLVAEVATVHQKQHTARAGELDEAVDRIDGREGFTASGGHLNEGAGTVFGKRAFEIGDRLDLCGPKTCCDKCRHLLQTAAQRREASIARASIGHGFRPNSRIGCDASFADPLSDGVWFMK